MKEDNLENDTKKDEFKPSMVPYPSLPLKLRNHLQQEALARQIERNRTVEKVKAVSDIDDCIENDTEELRRSIMPFDFLSLELRLELQEEADFQKRFEKQQEAIEKVKKIAQARYEYNKNWFDAACKGELNLEDHISTILISKRFLAKSKKQQEINLGRMRSICCEGGIDWKEGIKNDKNFFGNLLETIEKNSLYTLDVLYLKINVFHNYENIGNSQWNHENNEYVHCQKMLKILKPFLTQEFNCFFSQIDKHPVFHKVNKPVLCSVYSFNESAMEEVLHSYGKIVKKITGNVLLIKFLLENKVFLQWQRSVLETMEKLKIQEEQTDLAIDEKFIQEKTEEINFIESDLFEQLRSSFSLIYNLKREMEEIDKFINAFLDNCTVTKEKEILSSSIKAIKKVTKKCVEIVEPELVKSEIVEMVPVLDESFIKDIKRNESEEQFYQFKIQQLFLWQEKIKQRKAQKEEQVRIQRARIEDENAKETGEIMERQHAEQLITLYNNLDKDSKEFFNYCFDPSCKPQNIRFRHIAKLVESVGGTLDTGTGSSHFPIRLPNTKRIWEHAKETLGGESYLDVPKAMGGSYKPHNTSDEWSYTAHILLKKAFEKAGITPERLARAQEIMTVKILTP